MIEKLNPQQNPLVLLRHKAWPVLIIVVLLLGLFFRFGNLEHKAYNADEVRSFYRLSGYTEQEVKAALFNGEIISQQDIQRYQRPTAPKTIRDSWEGLASNPEHTPLYYLVARFWIQLFGSPLSARVLSVLLSLLIFPGVYWLCLELFNSALVGWIAILLVAVSPYHILVSQAAREYSFWTLMTVLSSAALLRALRVKTVKSWGVYSLTLILGLYSHLFFTLTAFGQGIYVLATEGKKFNKTFRDYLLTAFLGIICFIPWIWVILTNLNTIKEKTQWVRGYEMSLKTILISFKNNLGNVFIDFNDTSRVEVYLDYLVGLIVLYTFYLLFRYAPVKVWFFLLLLIVPTALAQIIPDLISDGRRSLQSRYFIPVFIGIQLVVAFGLAKIMSQSKSDVLRQGQQLLSKIMLAVLLSLGVVSGTLIVNTLDWDYLDQGATANAINLQLAPMINQSENPLIISEATHSFLLGLSYEVGNQVKFQLFQDQGKEFWEKTIDLAKANETFSDIFLYFPDQDFLSFFEQKDNVQLELLMNQGSRNFLYRVIQK